MAKKRTTATAVATMQAQDSSTGLLPLPEQTWPQAPADNPRQSLHYEGWLTLRTPLMHGGDSSFGTTRLFRSQKVICADGVVRKVPIYSGNAFRGMLRDIAADQLMEVLGVQLPSHVFDFLTSGGSLTASTSNSVDLGLARRLRETIPMIGLFGGGTGNQIIEGKIDILQLTPICQETIHLLPAYCREAPSAGLSVRNLRQMEFGTRRDDKKKEENQRRIAGPIPERQQDDVATQMIYETETLAPGTCLRFGFHARNVSQREWTCFAAALVGWLARPFLGGRGSAGYGEVTAPSLYRARRKVELLPGANGEDVIVDLEAPLATVESEIDREDRLQIAAADVLGLYTEDVRTRRQEIIGALREVV